MEETERARMTYLSYVERIGALCLIACRSPSRGPAFRLCCVRLHLLIAPRGRRDVPLSLVNRTRCGVGLMDMRLLAKKAHSQFWFSAHFRNSSQHHPIHIVIVSFLLLFHSFSFGTATDMSLMNNDAERHGDSPQQVERERERERAGD